MVARQNKVLAIVQCSNHNKSMAVELNLIKSTKHIVNKGVHFYVKS